MTDPRLQRRETVIFAVTAVPRILYLLVHPPPAQSAYWALSDSLLRHGTLAFDGQRTAQFEPLYPMFLAAARWALRAPFAVDLAQVAVASIGAIALYRLAVALTGDSRIGAVAVVLFAFDPLLVRGAVVRSDSALFTTVLIAFAAAAVTATTGRRAALAGCWLGLALLTRTTALPLLVLAPAALAAMGRPRPAIATCVVASLVFAPLAIRNERLNGSLLPTRSGLNLFIGNSPRTAALLPRDDLDLLQPDADAVVHARAPWVDTLPTAEAERAVDVLLTREAIAFIVAHQASWIRQRALNAWYLFSPRVVPYRTVTPLSRLRARRDGGVEVEHTANRPLLDVAASALFSAPVLVGALAGVWIRRKRLRRDAVLWAIALTIAAVNVVYVPATRYRAPMDFVLLFYAAIALGELRGRAGGSGGRLAATAIAAPAPFRLGQLREVPVDCELWGTIRTLLGLWPRARCPFHPAISCLASKNT